MLVTAVALAVLFPAGRVIVCQAEHAEHDQEAKKEAGEDIKEDDDLMVGAILWKMKQQIPRRCWMLPRMRHQWFMKEVMTTWA